MIRLVYVSRSLLSERERHAALADIVSVARARNAGLDISGALIHCRDRFAQVLEGTEAHVHRLMQDILGDPRHTDVKVVEEVKVPRRRFAGWTMTSAFVGDADFIHRRLESCLAGPVESPAVEELVDLFATLVMRGGVVQ